MRLVTSLLAAALTLASGAGQAQLLPAGKFASRDGRPGPGKTWQVNDAQGAQLAADMNAIAARTPIVVDYEHQTLRAAENGKPAPAAGWIRAVEWRKGEGLFATVDWTDQARAEIAAKQYQYISPVITSDEDTGAITGVLLAALTNHPGLLGMEAAVAQLAAQFKPTPQESDMTLLASLIAALGIAPATTETEALAAVSALKATATAAGARPEIPQALTAALGLTGAPNEAAALSAVEQLKGTSKTTSETIAALQGQIAVLTNVQRTAEVEALVADGLKTGKLVPAMAPWARTQGVDALKAFLAAAPAINFAAGQSGGKEPGSTVDAIGLTATQSALATQLGLDPKVYAKQLAEHAA